MLYLVPIDLNKNELRNALVHVLSADPGSPVEGQIYYNSTDDTIRFYTGAAWRVLGRLDQISLATAQVDLNGQKLVNLGTPTNPGDGVPKSYVDGIAQGIAWKDSARAATTAAGTLATSFANGQVVDGVTLATGDRILIKNQAAGAENGIYTVNAAGAPTRATDADASAELVQAALFVEEGTTNGDSLWVCTTSPITLGTTALAFAQIGAGTAYVGGAGLTLTGATFAVGAGTGITVNADDVALTIPVTVPNGGTGATTLTANGAVIANGTSPLSSATGTTGQVLRATAGAPAFGALDLANAAAVTGVLPVANGGTGAATAAAARAALGVPGRFAQAVGDGVATAITVTHNLGTQDVQVQVFRATTPWDQVICDVTAPTANTVALAFAVAPTAGQYRVSVMG